MTAWTPQPGDWVTVAAKVVAIQPDGEDVVVEVASHYMQQFSTPPGVVRMPVRLDTCKPAEKPIPDEPEEGSVAMVNQVAHQRLGDGHWYSAGEVGRADGLTWAQLHMLGDVEVIHHG